MENYNFLRKTAVMFLISFLGFSAFSQIPNVKKEIPEGKWVLQTETVRADKACNHPKGVHAHEVSMKSINILFYTEIEVKGDMLYFISDGGGTLQTKYTYDELDTTYVSFIYILKK
jgi:hypothetical protein